MNDETWFRRLLGMGYWPVHPKGWVALGCYLFAVLVTRPLALGLVADTTIIRAMGYALFLIASAIFFWNLLLHSE